VRSGARARDQRYSRNVRNLQKTTATLTLGR
jgi:hypothetical protein